MGGHGNDELTTPLVLPATITLRDAAALIDAVRANAAKRTDASVAAADRVHRPAPWIVLRRTRGFVVEWYLTTWRDVEHAVDPARDPAVADTTSLFAALSLDDRQKIEAVQFTGATLPRVRGEVVDDIDDGSSSLPVPRLVLSGTRVVGLVPPRMMSAAKPGGGSRSTRSARMSGAMAGSAPVPAAMPAPAAMPMPVGAAPPMPAAAAPPMPAAAAPPMPAGAAPAAPSPAPDAVAPADDAFRLEAESYINAPRRATVGKAFVIDVGLAAAPVEHVTGGRMSIAYRVGQQSVALDVQLAADGFTVAGANSGAATQTLTITRKDPFTPRAHFKCTALALDGDATEALRTLQVTYRAEGLIVGVATWSLVVQPAGATPVNVADAPKAASAAVAISTDAPPIDLTLTSAWKDDTEASHTLVWSWASPHTLAAPTGKLVRSSASLATLPLEIVDELAAGDGQDGVELLLGGIAQRIADEIPAGVWELLASVTDAVRAARGNDAVPTLLLVTQEARVPWELALLPVDRFPTPPGHDDYEQPRTIGTEFAVTRWLLDDALPPLPPHTLGDGEMVAVYGDYTNGSVAALPFAKEEATQLAATRSAVKVPADRAQVIALLSDKLATAPSPRIVHFAGHGEAARPGAPASFIFLNDGTTLSSTFFLNAPAFRKHNPLVFLNACQLAAAAPSLSQPGGFAAVLVRARCAAVVAPLWSVNDQVAHDIAMSFYDALFNDRTPAEAMREARQSRFTDVQVPDPNTGGTVSRRTATRLAYLVYGHPQLRV